MIRKDQYTRFISRLFAYDRTRIVLCNVLNGVGDGLVASDFVVTLVDWWRGLHNWRFHTSGGWGRMQEEEELLASLDLLLFQPSPPGFRTDQAKPDFLLACPRVPRNFDQYRHFVNVAKAESFINHYLHEDDRRKLAGTTAGRMLHDPTVPEIAEMVAKPSRISIMRLRPKSHFGRVGRVLWFTPWIGLTKVGYTVSADTLCAALGLPYFEVNDSMVALRIPRGPVSKSRHARPTFADAGGHGRFKSRPDLLTNRRNTTWGCTADLDAFATGAPNIDGLPERVVAPISFAKLKQVGCLPLGRLTRAWGKTTADDHRAFANRICGGRDYSEIEREFLEIYDNAA